MGAVGDDGDPADGFLKVVFSGLKQASFGFDGFKDFVVIAHDAADIHGDNGFGPPGDGFFDGFGVDVKSVRSAVYQHELCPHMRHHAGGGGIGVGGHNDLIAWADTEDSQGQLQGGGGCAEAGGLLGMAVF